MLKGYLQALEVTAHFPFSISFLDILSQGDGVTTSDTINSWGGSSDKSEVDSHSNSLKGLPGGLVSDGHQPLPTSKTPEEGWSGGGGAGGAPKGAARVKEKEKERRDMLFVSGMMGVKRRSLGTLRCWLLKWFLRSGRRVPEVYLPDLIARGPKKICFGPFSRSRLIFLTLWTFSKQLFDDHTSSLLPVETLIPPGKQWVSKAHLPVIFFFRFPFVFCVALHATSQHPSLPGLIVSRHLWC